SSTSYSAPCCSIQLVNFLCITDTFLILHLLSFLDYYKELLVSTSKPFQIVHDNLDSTFLLLMQFIFLLNDLSFLPHLKLVSTLHSQTFSVLQDLAFPL